MRRRRPGVLHDRDIHDAIRRGELVVEGLDPELVRPAAVSLRLGERAYVLAPRGPLDAADPETYPDLVERPVDASGHLVLPPGEVLLARTRERIGLAATLSGLLDGTSDWARLGVSVVLAHQVSPGYGLPHGAPLTLEIVSHLGCEIRLRPGMRIANLLVMRGRAARRTYTDMPAHHPSATWSAASRLGDAEVARGEL